MNNIKIGDIVYYDEETLKGTSYDGYSGPRKYAVVTEIRGERIYGNFSESLEYAKNHLGKDDRCGSLKYSALRKWNLSLKEILGEKNEI